MPLGNDNTEIGTILSIDRAIFYARDVVVLPDNSIFNFASVHLSRLQIN